MGRDSDRDDSYDVLGVQKDASRDEIRRSFKRQAKGCHPDLHPDDKDAQERFVQLNAAYDTVTSANTGANANATANANANADRRRAQGDGCPPAHQARGAQDVPPGTRRGASRPDDAPAQAPRGHSIAAGPVPGFGTMVEAACPACRGRGLVPSTGIRCAACGGRGWIRVSPATARSW